MSLNKLRLITLMSVACWRMLAGGVGEADDVKEQRNLEAESIDAIRLVKDVHEEWSRRCKELGPQDPRRAPAVWVTELTTVIRKRVVKSNMHAFMLAATSSGPSAELTGIHQGTAHRDMFVQALLAMFSGAGDRGELAQLLSRDFPNRMYYSTDVEFQLAFKCRKTLPDGIEVLFDAFDRSRDPKVQEKIAASIGRAFRANGLDFGKNKTTVDACRSWYAKNKANVEPNILYGDNIAHPQSPRDHYAMTGLFVSKPAAAPVRPPGADDSRNAPAKGDTKM